MTLVDRRDALQIIALGALPTIALAAWIEHARGGSPISPAVGLLALVAVASMIAWHRLNRFLDAWADEWRRRRRIARRYRLVRRHLSITCGCGTLARPIPGTRDRYRCAGCGQQWATSPHHLRPLRQYLTHADTPWPM